MEHAVTTHVANGEPASDLDADYGATLSIDAPPEAVFEALTSLSGLAGWWSTVSGSGLAGGELRFVFDGDEPCVMRVTGAQSPAAVRWICLGYRPLPDWAGTTLSFDVEPTQGGGCELRFLHRGLTPRLECYRDCKNGWDHFLPSLRAFAESGVGHPYGSSADLERRENRRTHNAATQVLYRDARATT